MHMMLKPNTRDLAKTLTFAILHFGVGFAVSYAFTGSVVIAGGIALVEPAVNTVVFFIHERLWNRGTARAAARASLGHLGHAHGFAKA